MAEELGSQHPCGRLDSVTGSHSGLGGWGVNQWLRVLKSSFLAPHIISLKMHSDIRHQHM